MPSARVDRLLLALLGVPLFFYGLGSYGLVNGDEGFYHAVARHMAQTGDWSRLEFAGQEPLDDTFTHAPLFLWAKAALILAFGDSYWTMRGLSAAFALLSVLATYELALFTASRGAALLAGLIQLTTFQFVYVHSGRTGEMEPLLAFAFTLSALFFLRSLRTGHGFWRGHLCLVALMNLKLLLVAIPVAAQLVFFAIESPARRHLRAWALAGLGVLPLGLAWHAYQIGHHWDALPELLEALRSQAAGLRRGPGGGDPLWLAQARFYAANLLFGTYPFAFLFLAAPFAVLAGAARRAEWVLLALVPAALLAFFLGIAIHHPWYTVPAIPFLCAFLGTWLARLLRRPPGPWALAALAVALALTASIEAPPLSHNPFADRAMRSAPLLPWRSFGPLGSAVGVPLACALAAVAALALGRRGTERVRRSAVAALALALPLATAAARVAAPLRDTDHISDAERIWREVRRAKAEGRPPEEPITVQGEGELKIRYYFADDFEIRRLRGRPRRWLLTPREDPEPAAGEARRGARIQ